MSRVNTPKLSESDRIALETGYRTGKTHTFRSRCHLILLKAEGRDSKSVGAIVQMCGMSVNNWVNRYKSEGIEGLCTKAGRGRKPLLSKAEDAEGILEAVRANRQRVDMAKAEWEAAQGGRTVSRDVFRRFLKALAAGTSESGGSASENPIPNSTGSR